ncbi:MAG TPA: hypothetical protein VGH93_11555 [Solirubrobacteraceae bacterium]
MQTYALHVSNGRDSVLDIRRELFGFPEVLDVFTTGRRDVLVVVCAGRPRPAEWLRALHAVGYESLARRHASSEPLTAGASHSQGDDSHAGWSGAPADSRARQMRRRSAAGLGRHTAATSITPCS